MLKVYEYCEPKNEVVLNIKSPSGTYGRLEFNNGNSTMRRKPRALVTDVLWANVIDNSSYMEQGLIKCVKSVMAKSDVLVGNAAPAPVQKRVSAKKSATLQALTEIMTLTDAQDYLANNFGMAVHNVNEARRIGEKCGVSFPNLQ